MQHLKVHIQYGLDPTLYHLHLPGRESEPDLGALEPMVYVVGCIERSASQSPVKHSASTTRRLSFDKNASVTKPRSLSCFAF